MSEIRRAKCDGCAKEVEYSELDGWFSVKTIIATQAVFDDALERQIAGINTPHGDFCSYKCVAEWASNGDILEVLERDTEHGAGV